MSKRYHCEFRDCKCNKYILHCNNLCYVCQHSKIWHSKKCKPPTDEYLSFYSTRESARQPTYSYVCPLQIAAFIPEAEAVPVVENANYCQNIDLLPI